MAGSTRGRELGHCGAIILRIVLICKGRWIGLCGCCATRASAGCAPLFSSAAQPRVQRPAEASRPWASWHRAHAGSCAPAASARKKARSRDQLLGLTQGREFELLERSIDLLISRLRQRLCDDAREPRDVKTVRNAFSLGARSALWNARAHRIQGVAECRAVERHAAGSRPVAMGTTHAPKGGRRVQREQAALGRQAQFCCRRRRCSVDSSTPAPRLNRAQLAGSGTADTVQLVSVKLPWAESGEN